MYKIVIGFWSNESEISTFPCPLKKKYATLIESTIVSPMYVPCLHLGPNPIGESIGLK